MMLASYDLKHWDFLEVESSTPVAAERSIPDKSQFGGLAQLARALDLHSRGHRFDSDILHYNRKLSLSKFAVYVL